MLKNKVEKVCKYAQLSAMNYDIFPKIYDGQDTYLKNNFGELKKLIALPLNY